MTNKTVRQIFIIFGLVIISFSLINAVPADPSFNFEITQPDGKKVTLRAIGDERFGHYQTLDGYTVIKLSDGWYYYANLDTNGQLVATTTKVYAKQERSNSSIQFLSTQTLDIKPSKNNRLYPDIQAQPELLKQSALVSADTTVNNVLVILIDFYDQAGIYDSSDFDNLMNQPGYDVYGSAYDFYKECSYDKFILNSDVDGWYPAENDYYSYGYHDGDNWVAAAQLAREAIVQASLDPSIDFSKYDNDGDGYVEGLFVVHAGPGAETGASDYPWSHKWWLSAAGLDPVIADGVVIDAYTVEPELHSGTEIARIGVFVHEYGHALGLPDLYGTNGIGSWGVMSGGSWGGGGKSPVQFCAWSKATLGWTNTINLMNDTTDVLLLDASTSDVSYRLWTEGMLDTEYFLVEYRGKTNFDRFIPGCGVAIWHIDETIHGNGNDGPHGQVNLVEANNVADNNAANVWINKTFGVESTPNSSNYAGDSTSVGVVVHSLTCEPNGMLVDLIVEPKGCCKGIRGNVDGDPLDEIDITDLVYLVDFIFSGTPTPICPIEANIDADLDGNIDISDLVFIVDFIFVAGPTPPNCN